MVCLLPTLKIRIGGANRSYVVRILVSRLQMVKKILVDSCASEVPKLHESTNFYHILFYFSERNKNSYISVVRATYSNFQSIAKSGLNVWLVFVPGKMSVIMDALNIHLIESLLSDSERVNVNGVGLLSIGQRRLHCVDFDYQHWNVAPICKHKISNFLPSWLYYIRCIGVQCACALDCSVTSP